MSTSSFVLLQLVLSSVPVLGIMIQTQDSDDTQLGVINKFGVTKYSSKRLARANSTDGFFWPDSTSRASGKFAGAADLSESVVWGWHHPNGVYNTIPVGAPLIDDEMKIYLASDDAIRKFDLDGGLLWTYAPRGQLASAPSLSVAVQRRESAELTAQLEDELRPDAEKMHSDGAEVNLFQEVKVGDVVRVRPGMGLHAHGKEYFKTGDEGRVTEIVSHEGEEEKEEAVISWTRTGHESRTQLASLGSRFTRVVENQAAAASPSMLVGSTTSGYVFAIDLEKGEEVWATQASDKISGVKGSVIVHDGLVYAATNRCRDRYCYRYRNQSNPLSPANTYVRALNANDGSAAWSFRPDSPVWNFVPQFGSDGSLVFSDIEGSVYNLNAKTGELKWKAEGTMGTYTQASCALFNHPNDIDRSVIVQLGLKEYDSKWCNPAQAPGILPWCSAWPGSRGWMRAISLTTGAKFWDKDMELPEPPAGATIAGISAVNNELHTRIIVTMGFNCHYNSPTQIWAMDPWRGDNRWTLQGPTLWTQECAGDFEGGDVRRAMGGRSICEPNSWSLPVVDSRGDIYVGNQVGVLQRYGSPTGRTRDWDLLSELNTGVAFQDQSIAIADGIMAVSTCSGLIVLQSPSGSHDLANVSMPW